MNKIKPNALNGDLEPFEIDVEDIEKEDYIIIEPEEIVSEKEKLHLTKYITRNSLVTA